MPCAKRFVRRGLPRRFAFGWTAVGMERNRLLTTAL
jgi:hypothetical protein